MSMVIAIDPGTEQSALVALNGMGNDHPQVMCHMTLPNLEVRQWMLEHHDWPAVVAVEMIASYGMAVGKETFQTCLWVGRFVEVWTPKRSELVYRRDVKLNLCHSARATDSNIREAILDRFGPGKDKAVGVKAKQGPLYGLKGHEYAALAVALTWFDLHGQDVRPNVVAEF